MAITFRLSVVVLRCFLMSKNESKIVTRCGGHMEKMWSTDHVSNKQMINIVSIDGRNHVTDI